jgi:hypothetical protein
VILSGSHRFPVVLIGSQWFSKVPSGSHRFSVVLIGFQWVCIMHVSIINI